MQPLALTDLQLHELRAAAASLPVQMRGDLLKLVAGYLEFHRKATRSAGRCASRSRRYRRQVSGRF